MFRTDGASRLAFGLALTSVFALTSAAPARTAELHVPSQFATIQAAIDAASSGDTVVVAAGTYTGPSNRNLNPKGKSITVLGAAGPFGCIIDCESAGRGFVFQSGEGLTCVISGFTIRNATTPANLGAGAYLAGASPTIRNCFFEQNDSGIYNGGGIYAGPNTAPIIEDCRFIGNKAGGGAAIFCETTFARISRCRFEHNSAGVGGAILFSSGASPELDNCLFTGNEAPDAAWGGGALFFNGGSTPILVNCTFSGNTATGVGGAIYSNKSSAPLVRNCVFWGDGPDEIYVSATSGVVTATYCLVQGGFVGTGNVSADPLFVAPVAGDFRLSPGSPAIDAANNTVVQTWAGKDLDGRPRFNDDPNTPDTGFGTPPIIDMGAYEFVGGPCYADINGDGLVGQADLGVLLAAYGECEGEPGYLPGANLSTATTCPGSGVQQVIDQSDLGFLLANYPCGEP